LALDQRHDLLAVLVLVLLGLPRRRQRLHELLGHRQLALGRRDGLVGQLVDAVVRDDLVEEDQRVHLQQVARGAHGDERLLVADDDLGDRHLARLAHRVEQQLVRAWTRRRRAQVVRVVVEDRVDLGSSTKSRMSIVASGAARAPRARRAR
jgi:hypothetical protein